MCFSCVCLFCLFSLLLKDLISDFYLYVLVFVIFLFLLVSGCLRFVILALPGLPRRYFCCGSLLLLVLAVHMYTLVQLLCE